MKLTKQKLIIAVSGGGVALLLGVYLFLYAPLLNQLKTTRQECRRREGEFIRVEKTISAAKREGVLRRLISEGESSVAIKELTGRGRAAGVNLVAVTPQAVKSKGRYKVLPIRMDVESNYTQLGTFLETLDGLSNSVVTVREFTVLPARGNPVSLKTKLTLDMYLKDTD